MNHHFDWIPGSAELRTGRKVESKVNEDWDWEPDDFDSVDFVEYFEEYYDEEQD